MGKDQGRTDAGAQRPADQPSRRSSTTIAFGSCRKQVLPQPIFNAIARQRPDVWVWTGDYLYFKPKARLAGDIAAALKASYLVAAATDGERKLRAAVPIIDGVYDDHDYGENDAGGSFELRELSRQLFLDEVLRAPADSPRRTQSGGLYGMRTFGEPPHQLKLLLLDTRFARGEPALPSVGAITWLPSPGNIAGILRALCALLGIGSTEDLLGSQEQWEWLEHELTNSTAAAHLIVSSVQVLTTNAPVESWGHFPNSRRRLLRLLARTRPPAALLISGDVHFAEFLGTFASSASSRLGSAVPATATSVSAPMLPVGAGLFEVTSSGLTHSCGDKLFGWVACQAALRLFGRHRLHPTVGSDSWPLGASFPALNFGSVVAHFDGHVESNEDGDSELLSSGAGAGAPHLLVRIHNVNGTTVMQHRLPLGLPPEAEALRWEYALAMPSVLETAAEYRWLVTIGGGIVVGWVMVVCAALWWRRVPQQTRRRGGTPAGRAATRSTELRHVKAL